MKKLLYTLLFVFALSSCTNDIFEDDQLEISGGLTDIMAVSEAQEYTIDFDAENKWLISTDSDFISFEPSSGEAGNTTVKVKVAENIEPDPRYSRFSIFVGRNMPKVVSVNQSASKPFIVLYDEKNGGRQPIDTPIVIDYDGYDYGANFKVYSNLNWEVIKNDELNSKFVGPNITKYAFEDILDDNDTATDPTDDIVMKYTKGTTSLYATLQEESKTVNKCESTVILKEVGGDYYVEVPVIFKGLSDTRAAALFAKDNQPVFFSEGGSKSYIMETINSYDKADPSFESFFLSVDTDTHLATSNVVPSEELDWISVAQNDTPATGGGSDGKAYQTSWDMTVVPQETGAPDRRICLVTILKSVIREYLNLESTDPLTTENLQTYVSEVMFDGTTFNNTFEEHCKLITQYGQLTSFIGPKFQFRAVYSPNTTYDQAWGDPNEGETFDIPWEEGDKISLNGKIYDITTDPKTGKLGVNLFLTDLDNNSENLKFWYPTDMSGQTVGLRFNQLPFIGDYTHPEAGKQASNLRTMLDNCEARDNVGYPKDVKMCGTYTLPAGKYEVGESQTFDLRTNFSLVCVRIKLGEGWTDPAVNKKFGPETKILLSKVQIKASLAGATDVYLPFGNYMIDDAGTYQQFEGGDYNQQLNLAVSKAIYGSVLTQEGVKVYMLIPTTIRAYGIFLEVYANTLGTAKKGAIKYWDPYYNNSCSQPMILNEGEIFYHDVVLRPEESFAPIPNL